MYFVCFFVTRRWQIEFYVDSSRAAQEYCASKKSSSLESKIYCHLKQKIKPLLFGRLFVKSRKWSRSWCFFKKISLNSVSIIVTALRNMKQGPSPILAKFIHSWYAECKNGKKKMVHHWTWLIIWKWHLLGKFCQISSFTSGNQYERLTQFITMPVSQTVIVTR